MSTLEPGPAPSVGSLPEGTVTMLFTDLVASTQLNQSLGDDASNAVRQEIEQVAMASIERHGGVVVKGLGDGLMVAFQSARRAVACARDVQSGLRERNREQPSRQAVMRIGLHTGEVIEDSGDLHGETVIIAKRIEGLAPPGGILASGTVYGVLGTARAELIDRGEFDLKGIEAPWRLFEVPLAADADGHILRDSDRSPYVGRTHEQEVLADLVARACEGHGSMVLVSGEAGVGKSRFIAEGMARAREHEMTILVGHCLDMDTPPPYQPLVEQLDQVARGLSRDAFREVLGENATEVARLMPEILRLYDDIGESPTLPPDQERRYLLHGFSEFVERNARRRPLVLCFEDLHWADESSLQLITALAQVAGELPLLLIGSYRPSDVAASHPLSRTREDLARRRLANEIRLDALSAHDVARLLEGRAGQPPPAELVSLVYDETEGNPFFVEEVFLHLKERGALFDDAGHWREGVVLADTEVPATVRLVIERRLERVGVDAHRALTAASVVGRQASLDLLLLVAGVEEDPLLDALEEAERASLVTGVNQGGSIIYNFVHEQIRQTLLAGLSGPRRQRLHARVAEALEQVWGADAGQHAADISHHLSLAGTAVATDRTVAYLELAARNALSAVAPEESVRHLDAALDLLASGETERRTSLLMLRARAHRAIPRIDEALADLTAALALAGAGELHDEILRQRADLYLDLFNGPAASTDLSTVLENARARGDQVAELQTLLALGRANYVRALDERDYALVARETYGAAHALAVELDDPRAQIEALLPTRWFRDYWTDYQATAAANINEVVRLADQIDDERLAIEVEMAGLELADSGDKTEVLERLGERIKDLRDPVRLKEHYFVMMWHYYHGGRLDDCVSVCDLGIDLARQLGSAPVQYGSIKALALTEAGRYDLVDVALAEEVTDDDHPFGRASQAYARTHFLAGIGAWRPFAAVALDAMRRAESMSRVWMQRGILNDALVAGVRAGNVEAAELVEIQTIAAHSGVVPSERTLAEIDLAAGRAIEARDRLLGYVVALEADDNDVEQSHALECLARAYVALGDWANALDLAEGGLTLATTSGQRPLQWRLRRSRAEVLDHLGRFDEAVADRVRSSEEFGALADLISDDARRTWFLSQWPAAASP
jgi:class 3 adenylate cyclase